MFKKPSRKILICIMNLILPDRTLRVIELASPVPVGDLLEREGINPLEVLVTQNGKLVTDDTPASQDDEIRLIRISHGG